MKRKQTAAVRAFLRPGIRVGVMSTRPSMGPWRDKAQRGVRGALSRVKP